jgi:S-DNA-T family DNA segregation ATPase FtsK/SpoIIIE
MVIGGLAGFGKTMLVAHLLGQLAPSPAVQFVLIDGKGGPDYDRLLSRAWLSAKDDLEQVRDVLRRVHGLMIDRQASIAQVLGVTDAWHLGPSPSWPLVVVVIDEAHTFFHERKGTSPEVKAHNALVAELSRLVEELIRKGRKRRHPSPAPHPAGHRGCHPDPDPGQLPSGDLLRQQDRGWGGGGVGGGDPPAPRRLPGPAE